MLKYIVNNAGLTMLLKFTVNLQNLLKEKKKKENLLKEFGESENDVMNQDMVCIWVCEWEWENNIFYDCVKLLHSVERMIPCQPEPIGTT